MDATPGAAPVDVASAHPAFADWFTPKRVAGILFLAIFAAYPEVILGQHTFFHRDYGLFGYPLAHYYHERFWQGELPLWNPLNNCGLPFLAQWNTLVLYPPSLFYLIFPVSWALGIFCLGHLFFGGMGMYFLAHAWLGNRWAGTIAALAYAFNGLTLNSLMWPNNSAGLSWLPWVLLAAQRGCRDGGRAVVLAAFAATFQMLAGAPEVVLLTWAILTGFLLVDWMRRHPQRIKVLLRFLAIGTASAGLAAAQLIPFLDLLLHSQRHTDYATAYCAMPGWGWANFLVPLFRCFSRAQVYLQEGQYWTSSYYLGIGPFGLALCAAAFVRERRVRLMSAMVLFALVLALGNDAFLYGWVRRVFPWIGFINFPVKFVIVAVALVPLLAAYGAVAYLPSSSQPSPSPRFRPWLWFALLTAMGLILAFTYVYPVDEKWPVFFPNTLMRAAVLLLFFFGLSALARCTKPRNCFLLALGLVLLVPLDVITHAPRQNPTASRGIHLPGFVRLEPKPWHGTARALESPEAEYKLRVGTTEDPHKDYLFYRQGLHDNVNLLENISQVRGFYSLYLREAEEFRQILRSDPDYDFPKLNDFLGVSQMTTPGKIIDWSFRRSHLPLATIGQQPLFALDQATLRGLAAPAFQPDRFVYLPADLKTVVTARAVPEARVVRSQFHHQSALVETESPSPALLVLAQTFYHPWQARIDGRRVPIWRANHAFQAVEIPAGRHTVVFTYRDYGFYAGLGTTAMTLGLLVVSWSRTGKSSREPHNS